MRVALLGYAGVGGASGGFFYDGRVVDGLRTLGATVDDVNLPWLGFGYARGLASNALRLPPLAGYDVVLQDHIVHPTMCVRNRRLRSAGLPVVAIVHNLTSLQPGTARQRLSRQIERAYLRSVDGIVAVCDSTRQDIEQVRGPGSPVLVAFAGRDHISSTVDDAAIEVRAKASGPLRLLFAGVVSPHKGLHRLVDALAQMPPGAVALEVAGNLTHSPDYVHDVRARVAAAGLTHHVRFHSELHGDSLLALYRQSHAFALPSDREAYSLAALDALGFGLPALLPSTGGSSELITDGVEGRLLPPDDIPAWTAAIRRFADDRAHLVACGRAALRRHRAHGTWADTAHQMLDFCEQVRAKVKSF